MDDPPSPAPDAPRQAGAIWRRPLLAALLAVALVAFARDEGYKYLQADRGGFPVSPSQGAGVGPAPAPGAPRRCTSGEFTALSYNVFLGSTLLESLADAMFFSGAINGRRPWSERSGQIRALIRDYAPDLLGLQEVGTDADATALTGAFPRYEVVSFHLAGLQDDDAAILFNADRFDLLDSGQVWLAPSREQPLWAAFKPWSMPRMANWALLRERATAFSFVFLNTHFDAHRINALEDAVILRSMFSQKFSGMPLVVTGDFNSTSTSPRYRVLTGEDQRPALLNNTYEAAHATAVYEPASGWRPLGPADAGFRPVERIDHILTGGACHATVDDWIIDARTMPGGGELSDHDPIVARLHFTEAPRNPPQRLAALAGADAASAWQVAGMDLRRAD